MPKAKHKTTINGYTYYRVSVQISGKRKYFYGNTFREAKAKAEEFRRAKSLYASQLSDFTVAEAISWWLKSVKSIELKTSSLTKYDGLLRNHIIGSSIENIKLSCLNGKVIQEYVLQCYNLGDSANVVRNVIKMLKGFLSYLEQEEIIPRNYASSVVLKKVTPSIVQKTFTEEELKTIRSKLALFIEPFIIELGFASGMRLGEMLALKDTDFIDGIGVWVRNALVSTHTQLPDGSLGSRHNTIVPPKSNKSIRFIPLPTNIFDKLKDHIDTRNQKLQMNEADYTPYLFLSSSCQLYNPSTMSHYISDFFQDECNCKGRTAHCMRHQFITDLQKANVPEILISQIAGHSAVSMSRLYTHLNPVDIHQMLIGNESLKYF